MNTTANNQDDYDSPWKEGMELYFKELMQFFSRTSLHGSHGKEDMNSLIKNCSK